MSNHVFIFDFVDIKPPFVVPQEETVKWLIERHRTYASIAELRTLEKYFRHYSLKKEKISNRYFVIPDIKKQFDEDLTIYRKDLHEDILLKANFFSRYTIDVFNSFYETKASLPDHLIHVTCTGYVSPSAPQVVVGTHQAATKVTHAYHMGCYAAFPAIRIAESLVRSGDSKKVDIVHTEACSLHMDQTSHTAEQIIVQTLFADGNIKYSLGDSLPAKPSLELLFQKEIILPDSEQDMRWELRKWGFAMTLSRSIPNKIVSALPQFLADIADNINIPLPMLLRQAIFAIHPGGPKIVENIAQQFDLREQQIIFSQKVLFERGNMSSATIPHVWQEILNANLADGQLIVNLAFGPGLSIFGSAFKLRHAA